MTTKFPLTVKASAPVMLEALNMGILMGQLTNTISCRYRKKVGYGFVSGLGVDSIAPCVVGVLIDDETAKEWDTHPSVDGTGVFGIENRKPGTFDNPQWFAMAQEYHDNRHWDDLRAHLEAAIA